MRPSFTLGIEEEYQTVDPETRDLRSHIATEMLEQGKLQLEERVKAEMHQSVIEVGTRICANIQEAQRRPLRPAPQHDPPGRRERPDARRRRHPPLRRLALAGDLPRPALRQGGRRPAARRALQPHLRPARPRRHRGQGSRNPHHELASLLPAAHPRALDQLALLARHGDRLQELPRQGLRKLPSHRIFPTASPATPSSKTTSNSSSRPTASTTPRRSGGTSVPTPSSTPSRSASATSPCAPRSRSPSPASSRPPPASSGSCTPATSTTASTPARC